MDSIEQNVGVLITISNTLINNIITNNVVRRMTSHVVVAFIQNQIEYEKN